MNYINMPKKVRDVNDNLNLTWKPCIVTNGLKSYQMLYSNFNNEIYLKPIKPYHNLEFEQIFNFGSCCSGFNTNKIVKIIE